VNRTARTRRCGRFARLDNESKAVHELVDGGVRAWIALLVDLVGQPCSRRVRRPRVLMATARMRSSPSMKWRQGSASKDRNIEAAHRRKRTLHAVAFLAAVGQSARVEPGRGLNYHGS
jgi:hypothetical protein